MDNKLRILLLIFICMSKVKSQEVVTAGDYISQISCAIQKSSTPEIWIVPSTFKDGGPIMMGCRLGKIQGEDARYLSGVILDVLKEGHSQASYVESGDMYEVIFKYDTKDQFVFGRMTARRTRKGWQIISETNHPTYGRFVFNCSPLISNFLDKKTIDIYKVQKDFTEK